MPFVCDHYHDLIIKVGMGGNDESLELKHQVQMHTKCCDRCRKFYEQCQQQKMAMKKK